MDEINRCYSFLVHICSISNIKVVYLFFKKHFSFQNMLNFGLGFVYFISTTLANYRYFFRQNEFIKNVSYAQVIVAIYLSTVPLIIIYSGSLIVSKVISRTDIFDNFSVFHIIFIIQSKKMSKRIHVILSSSHDKNVKMAVRYIYYL